jgi:hypothetical protein
VVAEAKEEKEKEEEEGESGRVVSPNSVDPEAVKPRPRKAEGVPLFSLVVSPSFSAAVAEFGCQARFARLLPCSPAGGAISQEQGASFLPSPVEGVALLRMRRRGGVFALTARSRRLRR